MRWRPKIKEERVWQDWFAWHPVTCIDGTKVWLETVERKVEYSTYDTWPTYRLRG